MVLVAQVGIRNELFDEHFELFHMERRIRTQLDYPGIGAIFVPEIHAL